MSTKFEMPDPGEGVHEVEIIEVHVKQGDAVQDGDALFSIETDKAAVDVPATFEGEIESVEVSDGDRVAVGDVLLRYSTETAARADADADADADDSNARAAGDGEGAREPRRQSKDEAAAPDDEPSERSEVEPEVEPRPEQQVPASPSTRRRAHELGIDLTTLDGSGPNGRVLARDVEAAAERHKPERRARRDVGERIPLRGVRRTIAERMSRAWREIPHVTHEELADITELERFRKDAKPTVEEADGKLTISVLVVKALAAALREFPRFNARLDEEQSEIVVHDACHVGIAVDTEDGLMVPVLRDVDRKSVLEIAIEARGLSERARQRKLDREALRGSTFTITNPGVLGGTSFTPIINPPEAAILGIGRARLVPTVQGDLDDYRLEPRLLLPLVLAFDHRLNDGADAARFVNRIVELLSKPEAFALRI